MLAVDDDPRPRGDEIDNEYRDGYTRGAVDWNFQKKLKQINDEAVERVMNYQKERDNQMTQL